MDIWTSDIWMDIWIYKQILLYFFFYKLLMARRCMTLGTYTNLVKKTNHYHYHYHHHYP